MAFAFMCGSSQTCSHPLHSKHHRGFCGNLSQYFESSHKSRHRQGRTPRVYRGNSGIVSRKQWNKASGGDRTLPQQMTSEVQMKMVKSLLLGSAAGLAAVTGAQAADMPVKARPVEYVKVCSLYGEAFFYIPGTDTCLKLGGYLRVQAEY